MSYTTILTETRGRVGLITLNHPQAMNALNGTLLSELMQALATFDADEAIGAMVITGSERAFAAGADIKEMAEASTVEMLTGSFVELFDGIRKIKKPVIAAVSGYALGGGCELAMSCDMIVASETAKFGQPEVTIGVIPGAGGTQRLTRAVGKAIAMEMVLNNRMLSAAEAAQFGLVNRVISLSSKLTVGQVLRIPKPPGLHIHESPEDIFKKERKFRTYIVLPFDTLSSIAAKFNVSEDALKEANPTSWEHFLEEAIALAAEIAARAPLAVRLGKEAVNKAFELSLTEGLEAERRTFYMLFATEDQKEGMKAFVEKRKAEWKGC